MFNVKDDIMKKIEEILCEKKPVMASGDAAVLQFGFGCTKTCMGSCFGVCRPGCGHTCAGRGA